MEQSDRMRKDTSRNTIFSDANKLRSDKVLGLARIQWEQLESSNNQMLLLLRPEGYEVIAKFNRCNCNVYHIC